MDPEDIINMDETCIVWSGQRMKVLAQRGQKYVKRVMADTKSGVTTVFTISAGGEMLPLYVIFKVRKILNLKITYSKCAGFE